MSGGNDLPREDIVHVIQSPFQKGMLEIFGASGVCYDSTHRYHEYREGFPSVWRISNHEDFTTLCTFCHEIENNTGTIKAFDLMEAMDEVFNQSGSKIFRNLSKFLLTFHRK